MFADVFRIAQSPTVVKSIVLKLEGERRSLLKITIIDLYFIRFTRITVGAECVGLEHLIAEFDLVESLYPR